MKLNPAVGGRLTVVAHGQVSSPDISANGQVVVYNEFKDGETAVYKWQAEDTVKLTTDHYPSMHPTVNEDGTVVAFTRYSANSPSQAGSWDVARWENGQTQMLATGPGHEMDPKISDDGRTVVWDDDEDGKFTHGNIVKWHDGEVSSVTTGREFNLFPELSGNGERVVWRKFKDGDSALWLQDEAGTVKPFLSAKGDLFQHSLSDSGTRLVFSDNSGADDDLMFHDERTGQSRMVAGKTEVNETWASISGDGHTIAWTELDFRKGTPAATNVFLEREGQVLQVTIADKGEGLNVSPELSRDGKSLVWTWIDSKDTDNRKIYKLDLE
ncbi:MAG: TolB family protein [Vulcanimicrobiota bacterium]